MCNLRTRQVLTPRRIMDAMAHLSRFHPFRLLARHKGSARYATRCAYEPAAAAAVIPGPAPSRFPAPSGQPSPGGVTPSPRRRDFSEGAGA